MSRWLAPVACALIACHSGHYVPHEPRSTAGAPARLRLTDIELERRPGSWLLRVTLAGSAVTARQPVEVWLSSAYADGCDGQPALVVPQPAGLDAYIWPVAERTFRGPTTIDVRASGDECVRVPLAHAGIDGRLRGVGRDEWLVTGRANLEFSSSPVTWSIISLTLGAGTWVGPLRTTLSTGIASARCSSATCPREENEQQLAGGLALPLDLALEGFVWSSRKRALSLSLRPGFRLSFVRAAQPLPRRAAFTPAIVLGYWVVPEQGLSAYAEPWRLEGGGAALELPIGLWQDLDQDRPTGFYVGLSGALSVPVD